MGTLAGFAPMHDPPLVTITDRTGFDFLAIGA